MFRVTLRGKNLGNKERQDTKTLSTEIGQIFHQTTSVYARVIIIISIV